MSRPTEVRNVIESPAYIRGIKDLRKKKKFKEILDVYDSRKVKNFSNNKATIQS